MRPEDMPAIRPDLIPATSWGSSLANLLTKPSWDSIRIPMIRWAAGCQICFEKPTRPLECHEVWAYSMPPPEAPQGTVGIQRLMALAVLCTDCHSMFHLGRARLNGTARLVKKHLIEVNSWSEYDYKVYTDQQERLGLARSNWHWALDVSLVCKAGPLVIKTGSEAWSYHDDEGGFLTAPSKYANEECFTVILGAAFRIEQRLIEAINPAEARIGLRQEEGDFAFAQWVRQRRVVA